MATSTDTTEKPAAGAQAQQQIDKVASTAHGAVDRAEGAADGAASAVRPFISRAAQAAHQKVDEAAAAVKPAVSWVAEKNEALAIAGRNAEADARNYIAAHPWQSVLAAVGVGYLLGRLAGRR